MFKADKDELTKKVVGFSYTDEETLLAVEKIYSSYNYVVCPHTAIAWQALKDWQQDQPTGKATGVFLSTAHPCKFPDVLPDHVSKAIVIPEEVKGLEGKTKHAASLGTDFEGFKKYLLKNG
jgi:threonine synthase